MKDVKTFFAMLKKINYILTPKQKKLVIIIPFLSLGTAVFEALGVSAILPFVQAILTPEELMKKKYIAGFVQFFQIEDVNTVITITGLAIIFLYVIKNVYLTGANYIQLRFRLHFFENISIRLLDAYMKRPYSYFITTTSSTIIRSIQNDSNSVFDILNVIFQLVSQGMVLMLLSVLLLYSDWMMALGILGVVACVFLGVTYAFKGKLSEYGVKSRTARGEQYKYLYEPITGAKDIKVMQRSQFFTSHFCSATKKVTKATKVYEFFSMLPERIIETVCVTGIIGIVCLRLGMGVDISEFIPKLAVFAVAAFRILPAISKSIGYFQTMVYYRPSLDAAYEDMKAFYEYEESMQEYYLQEKNRLKDKAVPDDKIQFSKELILEDIDWKYDNSPEYVLKGLSLKIEKGEAVAFIGTSGAGKSTLADVILGLLRPEHGSVKMDDFDIFAMPRAWSRIVGYVPQTVFLIDDTIRANITFGIEDSAIEDEDVWKALELAQLKEFVEGLPEQLDSMVGERGIRFSGGQKQRIAIARALYHNPDILVLDEATSALDGETERALMEAIERLHGVKTLIIIAHRLSTIQDCDRIYEVCNGVAVEKDNKEILQKNSVDKE